MTEGVDDGVHLAEGEMQRITDYVASLHSAGELIVQTNFVRLHSSDVSTCEGIQSMGQDYDEKNEIDLESDDGEEPCLLDDLRGIPEPNAVILKMIRDLEEKERNAKMGRVWEYLATLS